MASSARVLSNLVARDAHIDANTDGISASPQSQSYLNQTSTRPPSRFELRQAALRAPSSLSSSHSTDDSSSSSSGRSGGGGGMNISTVSSLGSAPGSNLAPSHPQPYASPLHSHDDADQPPSPLRRTAASILRAASASSVRYISQTRISLLLRTATFIRHLLHTANLPCRLCLQCCEGVRRSCRVPWKPQLATLSVPALLSLAVSLFAARPDSQHQACCPAECSGGRSCSLRLMLSTQIKGSIASGRHDERFTGTSARMVDAS
jgi:hypothetical protein